VAIDAADHSLAISVIDDGRGFDPPAVKLSGLRGLEDRAEALGGQPTGHDAAVGAGAGDDQVEVLWFRHVEIVHPDRLGRGESP